MVFDRKYVNIGRWAMWIIYWKFHNPRDVTSFV